MDCDSIVRDETAERYLMGQLRETEQAAYEQHYFECARCFAELSRLQAVREVLREHPPLLDPIPIARRPRARRACAWWPAVAVLAATVTGVVVLLRQGQGPERSAQSPVAAPLDPGAASQPGPATAITAPAPGDDAGERPSVSVPARSVDAKAVLKRLARVDPPHYMPRVLRGPADEPSLRFHDGMRAYATGDYRRAVTELERAAALDSGRSDVAFYLGVSRLMNGETDAAVAELRHTVELGDPEFLGDAHLVLAKAYLGGAEIQAATRELEAAARTPGTSQHEAARILAELQQLELD